MTAAANFRRFAVTLLVVAVMSPWLATASLRTISSMFNAPARWVPETVDYRRDSAWFAKAFRGHEMVLLSFPGCDIDNPALAAFSREINNSPDATRRRRHQRLFEYATTGPEILASLEEKPLSLSRRNALARLRGVFFGSDGTSTCAMVALTLEGAHARNESIAAIRETALRTFGISDDELVMVGSIVDGAAIDKASSTSVNQYTIPSAIVIVFLCWVCLRSWILTGVIVAAGYVGQGLVLALMDWQGDQMNAILTVLPVLVYALTVSAGVHLANYYRDALSRHPGSATSAAISSGWLPCLLSTLTTIIGLASLSISVMTPIRDFSRLACVGVTVSVALLFLLLPAGMDFQTRLVSRFAGTARSLSGNFTLRIADVLVRAIIRAPNLIAGTFLVAMCLLAVGVARVETSVNIRTLFKADSEILQNYRWMEHRLGPLVPVEVVLQFGPDNELTPLERMQLVRDAHVRVATMDDVGGTLSAATFFPNIPTASSIRETARRSVLRKQLAAKLQKYVDLGYVAMDEKGQSWRIETRVSAIGDLDYGVYLDRLRGRLDPFLRERADDTITTLYTGSLPVAYQAQRDLLDDLFVSYVTAFSLVAIVMIVVLRRFWAGLIVMMPNLFPTLLLFGWMGWNDIPVDIGSVMTASVALGIAVDDTLHFLLWFRRKTASGMSPQDAVRDSFCHCGRAMTQTSVILASGLALFAWSDFVPTQRFSGMMIGLLAAALIGDLVLLPALLLGRTGKLFRA